MRVTVIGAGNGGLTAAYVLAKNGHEVCIYDSPKFPAQINAVHEKGGITALDEDNGAKMLFPGFAQIAIATTDVQNAMEFLDTFMMVCPSFAQEIMFSAMLPYLKDEMKFFVIPGNYGGLVLNKMVQHSEKRGTNVTFIDTISLPWATRAVDPGTISIMGVKEFMPLSIFPKARQTEDIPYLFVPFCELAKICGVEVPADEALITLENIYNDVDYRKTGRTLDKMGFNHWTKQEILAFPEL